MKALKYMAGVILAALALSSCQKELDIPQKGVLDMDEYYATAGPEEAESLIARVYDLYLDVPEGAQATIFMDILSDDMYAGGNSFTDNSNDYQMANNLICTSSDWAFKNVYPALYKIIYYCNLIIERIPETSDARVNRVKAEANFMRSICLFQAIRWWGTPPFADHVYASDEIYAPNGNTAEMIEWILKNLKDASDKLPAISAMGAQQEFGARVSKHAALAYMGKVALWYGTKINDKNMVARAIDPLKTVIMSGLYDLIDDPSQLGRPAADFCKEYIFEHNASESDGYPAYQADNRHIWRTPRPEHMNLPDQLYPMGWGFCVPTGDFGRFLESHEGGVEKPRFKASILTYDQIVDMSYTLTSGPGVFAAGIPHCEGYFNAKTLLYREDIISMPGWWKYSKSNVVYMRYAEVLLLYAEAQFVANGDADGSGADALNVVRRRAQIPEVGALTYQIIKDERRAELFAEQERYFDLVRWGDAATALKDKGKKWYTFYGYKPGTKEWRVESVQGNGKGWDDKYNLLPFPYEQVAANKNLVQNPNW
mgnify:FL=1